jgi:streptogramin lyase
VANTFTLQLNVAPFTSPMCSASPNPSCQGWQQFIYETSSNQVFIQYWLLSYGAVCPSGWTTYQIDCYTNSSGTTLSPGPLTVGDLTSTQLTGDVSSGDDTVTLATGSGSATAVATGDPLGLIGSWSTAEFGIFGDGNSSAANFSANTTLNVETTTNEGDLFAPTCTLEGFTGETNNLNLVTTPALAPGALPAILSEQSNSASAGPASCSTAPGYAPTTLNPPANSLLAPGTLQAFSGTLAPSQSAGDGTVTMTGGSGAVLITVVHWDANGIVIWIPPGTPVGDYTVTVNESNGSASVPITLTPPTVASETITPLYRFLGSGEPTSMALGVTQDQSGDLWFSDGQNNSIDELTTGATLRQYPLSSPDSGPTGIAVDQSNNVWVTQKLIGQVTELNLSHASPGTTSGETTFTLAGDSPDGLSVDPYGNVWIGEGDSGILGEITASTHTLKEWYLGGDLEGMLADSFGNVWVINENGSSGVIHVVPSQLPAPTTASQVTAGVYQVGAAAGNEISGGTEQLVLAPNGDVWFTEWGPAELGVIVPSSTNPADDTWSYAANYPSDGSAPSGIGVDAAGNLFVSDAGAQRIYKFTPGTISTTSSVPGTWKEFSVGTWITNFAEGDEGDNLEVAPSGNVSFTGYMTNTAYSGTPYGASDVQGYIGTLPGVAVPASSTGITITDGTTSGTKTTGKGGDTLQIAAKTFVALPSGAPFSGTVPPPVATPTYVPKAPYGEPVAGSAFAVTPQEKDGLKTHLSFSKPVKVTFRFSVPKKMTAATIKSLTLWTYDAATGSWTEAGADAGNPGGVLKVSGGKITVTVHTYHLSSFALLKRWKSAPYLAKHAPRSLHVGSKLTLHGYNFGKKGGAVEITSSGPHSTTTLITASYWSSTTIRVVIPSKDKSGTYTVAIEASTTAVSDAIRIKLTAKK